MVEVLGGAVQVLEEAEVLPPSFTQQYWPTQAS